MDEPEDVWQAILSQDAALIRRAWLDLTDDEAIAVLEHLARMKDDEGWHEDQRQAAATALQVIYDQAQ